MTTNTYRDTSCTKPGCNCSTTPGNYAQDDPRKPHINPLQNLRNLAETVKNDHARYLAWAEQLETDATKERAKAEWAKTSLNNVLAAIKQLETAPTHHTGHRTDLAYSNAGRRLFCYTCQEWVNE